jgi:hypothetical protein
MIQSTTGTMASAEDQHDLGRNTSETAQTLPITRRRFMDVSEDSLLLIDQQEPAQTMTFLKSSGPASGMTLSSE